MQDKNSYSSITRLKHNSPTTDKSLKLSNYVHQVTSFDPPILCPQHYHDNISYICIDCRFKCLCGTCLQEGTHKAHHIKNIDKGSKIIERALNEALIRLRSKSDLLTNLKDYMKIRKSDIFQQYKEYQKTLINNLDSIALDLQQKRRKINDQIQNYRKSIDDIIDSLIDQINEQSVTTLEIINIVQTKSDKFKQDPVSLCLFYEDKNIQLEKMVSQSTSRFEFFKKQVPDINWSVNLDIFDTLKNQINSLDIETNQEDVILISNFVDYKKAGNNKQESNHLKRFKNNYFLACKTPKPSQGNRNTVNNFRSPGSNLNKKQSQGGRLNSMPVSPSKDKSPKKKSNGKVKAEQLNKKFKKSKK